MPSIRLGVGEKKENRKLLLTYELAVSMHTLCGNDHYSHSLRLPSVAQNQPHPRSRAAS